MENKMLKPITIVTISDLFEVLNSFSNSCVFRGHLSANWKIESSLVRNTFHVDDETYYDLENTAITEFESKFNVYGELRDKPKSRLGWLSIMQHYGAPTRLIDFTTSPFVALGFIIENLNPCFIENQENQFSIFALNYTRLNEILLDKLISNKQFKNYSIEQMYINAETVSDYIFSQTCTNVSYFMINEPLYANKRIDRQNGTFLISNRFLDIEETLAKKEYEDIDLTKILIPSKLYRDIFCMLRKMNINLKTIYGDLDGLGKFIKSNLLYYSNLRRLTTAKS